MGQTTDPQRSAEAAIAALPVEQRRVVADLLVIVQAQISAEADEALARQYDQLAGSSEWLQASGEHRGLQDARRIVSSAAAFADGSAR